MKPYRSIESIRNEAAFRATEDRARGNFLRALDDSDFAVDEWETTFLTSFLDFTGNRPSDEPRWWTEGRRRSVDRMMLKYPEVARQAGIDSEGVPSRAAILSLPTTPGRCDYLIRRDGAAHQTRCGEPAVATTRAGLQLCAEHFDYATAQAAKLREWKTRNLRG